jgi:hypothetical protein
MQRLFGKILKFEFFMKVLKLIFLKNLKGVKITNFSSSFADGLAFCAIMHNNMPDAFDFNNLSSSDRRRNFELAFETAQ